MRRETGILYVIFDDFKREPGYFFLIPKPTGRRETFIYSYSHDVVGTPQIMRHGQTCRLGMCNALIKDLVVGAFATSKTLRFDTLMFEYVCQNFFHQFCYNFWKISLPCFTRSNKMELKGKLWGLVTHFMTTCLSYGGLLPSPTNNIKDQITTNVTFCRNRSSNCLFV